MLARSSCWQDKRSVFIGFTLQSGAYFLSSHYQTITGWRQYMHFVAIATAHLLRGRYGMCGEDREVQQDEQTTATWLWAVINTQGRRGRLTDLYLMFSTWKCL